MVLIKGRDVYAGLSFIKVAIDFPEAEYLLMLAGTIQYIVRIKQGVKPCI